MTIKFHFRNIDESIEFVQQSKSMLIGFNHKFDIEDDGKTVVIKVETIKNSIKWEVEGKCFYMN